MIFGANRRARRGADGPAWLYAPQGHLRAPWRLLLFAVVLFAVSMIVPAVIVPLFSGISRWAGEPVPAYPWVMLAAVAIAVAVMVRVVDEEWWDAIAMQRDRWTLQRLVIGWSLGIVVIACTALLLWVGGYLQFVETAMAGDGGSAAGSFTAMWLGTALRLLLLLAPAALWEELVFRGYLWKVAEDAGGAVLALWSSSVAFGIVHLSNPNAGVRTTVLVILAGLCLGAVRMRVGLPAAWLAHLAWNWAMAAVMHVPVSGIGFAMPGYRAELVGPSWLTGGDWGPEGGLVAAVVLASALLVAQRRHGVLRPASSGARRERTINGAENERRT